MLKFARVGVSPTVVLALYPDLGVSDATVELPMKMPTLHGPEQVGSP